MKQSCVKCYNEQNTPVFNPKQIPKSKNAGFDFTLTGTNQFKQAQLTKEAKAKMEEHSMKNDKKSKHDLFVNTLQQEIGKLEHELGYMKEQDLDNTQGLMQMDKFFSDGVPINNNILALKSQYQTFTDVSQRDIAALDGQRMEELKRVEDLKADNEAIRYRVDEVKRDFGEHREVHNIRVEEMKGLLAEHKKFRELEEQQIDQVYGEFKRINDENVSIHRNVQRLKVLGPQTEEQEKHKVRALQGISTQRDEQILAFEDELQRLVDKMSLDASKTRLEQENIALEERLMKLEKQMSMAQIRIRETEVILDGKTRERENEAILRRELINNIDKLRFQLEEALRFGDTQMDQKINQRHNAIIRGLQRKIEATGKEIAYYDDRKRFEEKDIERMTSQKTEMKLANEEALQLSEYLARELMDKKNKLLTMVRIRETNMLKVERLAKQNEELDRDLAAHEEAAPKTIAVINEYKAKLDVIEKQIEFAKQIKALNMDHLKVSSNSNTQMNNNLNDFIRKFEDIQKTAPSINKK